MNLKDAAWLKMGQLCVCASEWPVITDCHISTDEVAVLTMAMMAFLPILLNGFVNFIQLTMIYITVLFGKLKGNGQQKAQS